MLPTFDVLIERTYHTDHTKILAAVAVAVTVAVAVAVAVTGGV